MEINITLTERVPSKKNNQRILKTKSGRRFIAPSAQYAKWHKSAMIDIQIQTLLLINNSITYPIALVDNMVITVFFPDKRRQDTINKSESILDLLVDSGVIKDDDFFTLPSILLIGKYRKNDAGAEILINI